MQSPFEFRVGNVGGLGRAHVSHPIARPGVGVGRPGIGVGRPGYGVGVGYRRGYGVGTAAVIGAGVAYSAGYPGYYGDTYYNDGFNGGASDAIAACAQRFRSYDPATQTYVAKGGVRVRCP